MSKAQVNIRFATDRDIDDCISFDHCKKRDIISNKIEMREVIVAEYDAEIIGYLKIEYIWSILPYISLIYINKEFRGNGIGTKMLKFLESFLLSKGYKLLLSSSQVNEIDPQSWHRSKGFEECGVLLGINESGIGEIFFKKMLA
jgi:GNAT superfamily N-acetyltransferase